MKIVQYLVGEDGTVIIDTTETVETAIQIKEAFGSVVDFAKKPVKAIIYTHNHQDHIFGTTAFIDYNSTVPVYAHSGLEAETKTWVPIPLCSFSSYLLKMSVTAVIGYSRAMRQFGALLPPEHFVSCGLGHAMGLHADKPVSLILPNHVLLYYAHSDIIGF